MAGRTGLSVIAAIGALLTLLLTAPGSALAHSELTGTEIERPGGAPDRPAPPAVVTLSFTEKLDPGFARVDVVNEDGDRLEIEAITVTPDRLHLRVEIPSAPDGPYTVGWFVRSQDGDASNGSTRIRIGGAADPLSLLPPVGARDPAWHPPMTWDMTSMAAILRWLNYLGLMLAVGAVFFLAFVWPATAREPNAHPTDVKSSSAPVMPGFRELTFAGLGLLFFTNILLLLLQASFLQLATLQPIDTSSPIPLDPSGLPQARAANAVGEILTTWAGWVWTGRMVLAATLAVLVWRMPRPISRKSGVFVGTVAAAAAILLTISLTSHAAFVPGSLKASLIAVAIDWTHLLAMSLWLGGLLPLLLALRHFRSRSAAGISNSRRLLHRFSPIALGSVLYLAVTGVASSYFLVGDPLLLFRTVYGVTLDVKLGLVGLLVLMGAVNRYVLIPRVDRQDGAASLADEKGPEQVELERESGSTTKGAGGFIRSLPIELTLGSLLLLTVGMLASLGAASTAWPAHETLGLARTKADDDVELTLRIAPGESGENGVGVDVTDRRRGAWRTPGRLMLTMEDAETDDAGLPTERVAEESILTERYVVPDLLDLPAGETSVHVTLEREGYAAVEALFESHIQPADE